MPDRSALRAVQAANAELYAKLRRGWWWRRREKREPQDLRAVFREPRAEEPC